MSVNRSARAPSTSLVFASQPGGDTHSYSVNQRCLEAGRCLVTGRSFSMSVGQYCNRPVSDSIARILVDESSLALGAGIGDTLEFVLQAAMPVK
ncbi:hypothetical protein RRG08_066403 [Elysia crispata]|uniref:Uncharacterized protein n=1 Tax=Elysia crispata TaxID=231223 RepID=A0AAE1D3V1_9GAST|nr:hypothetical protein RRG08_066403 [Elysia crispata]